MKTVEFLIGSGYIYIYCIHSLLYLFSHYQGLEYSRHTDEPLYEKLRYFDFFINIIVINYITKWFRANIINYSRYDITN